MTGQETFSWDELDDDLWSIQERFERFHTHHPEVAEQLVLLTRRAMLAGRNKVGMGMLFEVLRWERLLAGLPDETETYKLNNDYRSRYARMIMATHPELDGIYETRRLKTL